MIYGGLRLLQHRSDSGTPASAGVMAGTRLTMSLFIAGQRSPDATDLLAAKIALFATLVISAVLGTIPLWKARWRANRSSGVPDARY